MNTSDLPPNVNGSTCRKRRKHFATCALAGFLLALILGGILWQSFYHRGPRHEGRRIVEWLDDFHSPVSSTRDAAGRAIEAMGPRAVPGLIRTLETANPFWDRTILKIGPRLPPAVRTKLYKITNPTAAQRRRTAAVLALDRIAPVATEAVPALTAVLDDPHFPISYHAASALSKMGDPGVAGLISALSPDRPAQFARITDVLGRMGAFAHRAVPVLAGYLGHSSSNIASMSAHALAAIGPAAVPTLAESLRDSRPLVRHRAAFALGEIGPRARTAVAELLEAVRDEETNVRLSAIQALGKVRPSDDAVVAALESALEDGREDIRLRAVEALGRSERAVEQARANLRRAAESDPSDQVRHAASHLLRSSGGLQ